MAGKQCRKTIANEWRFADEVEIWQGGDKSQNTMDISTDNRGNGSKCEPRIDIQMVKFIGTD